MNDGVEEGKSSSEWTAAQAAPIGMVAAPVLNLLAKRFLGEALFTPDQLTGILVALPALAGAFMGLRTWRKTNAANNGLHDAALAQAGLDAAKALSESDPNKGAAIAAALKGLGA